MPTEVLEKKQVKRTCGECGTTIAKGVDTCPTHEDAVIKKSLIIVRKETADEDDDDLDIANAEIDDLTGQIDDLDDEDEDDDDEDEDEDDDEDEEEDDEEEEDAPEPLSEVGKRAMAVETLNLSTSLAEKIVKIFHDSDLANAESTYETAMTDFNSLMDAAAQQWLTGASVSKASEGKKQTKLIHKRVSHILKEGGTMPKTQRPKDLKLDELPDDVKAYITSLEGDEDADVEKRIYKNLSPEAAEIVRKSAKVIEENTAQKYLDIAKGLTHVPGDKSEIAKALRLADETSPTAYKTLLDSFTASNENLKQSDIFKSYGNPGNNDGETPIEKKAKDLVEKGTYPTIEQAKVALMDGASSYRPTA